MKQNVLNSLSIMWKGMLAIFIVTALLILSVWVLNLSDKFTKKRKDALAVKKEQESSIEKSGRGKRQG